MKGEKASQKVAPARRIRHQISAADSSVLLQVYEQDRYPVFAVRQHLADRLMKPLYQINRWFCEQHKKDHIERKRMTKSQIEELKMIVEQNPLADKKRICELAYSKFDCSDRQVANWVSRNSKRNPNSRLTQSQFAVLNQAFVSDPFPTNEEISNLATELNLKAETVINWFRRRRHQPQKAGQLNERINLHQRKTLSFLARNPFPTLEDIEKLAADLQMTPETVRCWLETCRRREMRQSKQLPQNLEIKWFKQLRLTSFQLQILNKEVSVRLKNDNFAKQTIIKRNAELSKRLGLPHHQMCRWIHRKLRNHQTYSPFSFRFSSEQVAVLREEFAKSRYITKKRFWEVFSKLGLSHLQVKRWFKLARSRLRRNRSSLVLSKNCETELFDKVSRSNMIGETSKSVTS